MKVSAVALALSPVYRIASAAILVTLMAAPSFAQAPPAAAPAPAPQGQAPAPAPAQPATPAPVFQTGLKYAYVNVQAVASQSADGKALNAKVQALQDQKVKELQQRNQALQASQQKLEQGSSVLNDQARVQLQQDIDRQQREIQRFTEDAQAEVQNLLQQLQLEFEKRLLPVIQQVAMEKQVHFVFNAQESGLIWADPSMDLTGDIIKALDATK